MIGVGIIGAGYFGEVHARAIAAVDGLRLTASCRSNAEAVRGFADMFGGAAYTDWQKLLGDPSVDAVAIATPHHLHEEIAVAAAEAGKHILIEKPMAHSAKACDAIISAAETAGIKLLVGHIAHFSLPSIRAREILTSGTLGRPVLGNSRLIKLWMEENRRSWHLSPETGGGMLMTAGIHPMDLLIWLMGGQVEAVSAFAGTFFHDQAADDTALISLRFPDGGLGQVQSVGYRDGAMTYDTDIVCENGVLRIDQFSGVSIGVKGDWSYVDGSFEENTMHCSVVREWQSLRDSIVNSTDVAVSGAYARHLVDVIEAVSRSSALRKEIALA